jgi:hypothetical protein
MPPPFGTGDLDHRDAAIGSGRDRRGTGPPQDGTRVRRPTIAVPAQVSALSGTTSNDSVAELFAQIRMLRAALSDGICESVGVQLLIARWHVQELRLMHLDRQRAETAARRLDVARMRTRCAEQLDHMENRLIRSGSQSDARQGVEAAIGGLRAKIAAHQATEKSLRSEEQALLSVMSTEQVRWRDLNSRLDELERRLPGALTWALSLADRTVTQRRRRVADQMVPRRRKPGKKRVDRPQVSGSP